MGAWGPAILSDDLARDIFGEYVEMYNDGEDHSAIRARLEATYSDAIGDADEGPVFWLALARAQWECGALEPDVLEQVRDIVTRGRGIECWRAVSEAGARKRRHVLATFLTKIETPREPPRKRRVIKHADAVYEPGDCLAIRLSDGDYGAALVLAKDDSDKTEGMNLLGVLRYKGPWKPTQDVFETAPWLTLTHHGWENWIALQWCLARVHKKQGAAFERVGHIPPREAPRPAKFHGPTYGGWNLGRDVELQFAWERQSHT
jgi:hypothetical protein